MKVLDAIKISPDLDTIRKGLHLSKDAEWERVCRLIDQVWPLMEPKAVYRVSEVTAQHPQGVKVNEILFNSQILKKQVDPKGRVFPYVVTIGDRLERRIRSCGDILEQYYLDFIGNSALSVLQGRLEDHLSNRYDVPCLSSMAPGSLEEWPVEEQAPLFSVIGDVKRAIGVSLTDVFLMVPTKSESGIFFPTEGKFYSCRLCPRENCTNRKAAYDEKAASGLGDRAWPTTAVQR